MLSIFAMLSPSECRNLAVAAQLMPRNGLTAGRSSYISSYCNASPLHPNINHSRRNWQSTLCSRVRTSLKKKTQRKSIGTGRLVMEPSTLPRPGKRLIVACDGTWMDSDNGFQRDSYWPWNTNGHLQVPSNVTRITRAVRDQSADGIPQIVYYQAGVGSESNSYDRIVGGGTGEGISENIREAYAFLADNYHKGDEIFLLGFSRGAFTARSIAGLIACIGLLTKEGMADFYEVFKDWENQITPDYKPKFPDIPFPNKPNVNDPRYMEELKQRQLTRPGIPIRAVAVWDTVGSLGIPNLGLWPQSTEEYSFINTVVSPNIEYAFHALALDEHRKPFSPTIWEQPDGQALPRLLKQCWFPGVHSNIGGGYPDSQISDITLAWMISHLESLIDFNKEYILRQHELNIQYYESLGKEVRPWGCGETYNSFTGLETVAGSQVRTPGFYNATDPHTGKDTGRPLRNTNEYMHASVRIRLGGKGLGRDDKGVYKPKALEGWTLRGLGADLEHFDNVITWEHGLAGKETKRVLPEDDLGELEKALLMTSPSIARRVMDDKVGTGLTNGAE